MIPRDPSFGTLLRRRRRGEAAQLLDQSDQGLEGRGAQDGGGGRVKAGSRPVGPLGGNGEGGLRRALQDEGFSPIDATPLQNEETLTSKRMEGMGDPGISRN